MTSTPAPAAPPMPPRSKAGRYEPSPDERRRLKRINMQRLQDFASSTQQPTEVTNHVYA